MALLVTALVFTVQRPTTAAVLNLALGLLIAPLATVLGVFITRRPGGGRVGMLLSLIGFGVAAIVARETWEQVLVTSADRESWSWLVAVLAEAAWWVVAGVALLLLYFPDGRVPGPRWWWALLAPLACVAVTAAHGVFDPKPLQFYTSRTSYAAFRLSLAWFDVVDWSSSAPTPPLALVCACSLVFRHRHSDRLALDRRSRRLAPVGVRHSALPGAAPARYCAVRPAVVDERRLWVGGPDRHSCRYGGGHALEHDLYDVYKALATTVTWTVLNDVFCRSARPGSVAHCWLPLG